MLQTELVFLDVFRGDFSPFAANMTSKKFVRLLARFFKRSQRTGGGSNMPKREERLHPLLFSARAAWKCLASTPALARCSQVIFGPCGPYTFTNCALVGRPARAKSRVPSAMCARADLDLTLHVSVPPRTWDTISYSLQKVNNTGVLFWRTSVHCGISHL